MVIGGSGFIGSRVVDLLTRNSTETLSYDVIRSNFTSESAKWVMADVLELSSIRRLLFEYDVGSIIHLVGLPAVGYCEKHPHFSFELNVLSVQNTLEAMRKTDIERIVFASSAAVHGYHSKTAVKEDDPTEPSMIYGYHKLIAEEAIKSYSSSYGLNYAILRLFNVYGGDPHVGKDVISIFVRRALRGEPIVVNGPNKFRDFVHANDVADIFMKAITTNVSNLTVNVGTGRMTTLQQVAETMEKCFPEVKVNYEMGPDDGTGLVADITAAKKAFSFSPRDPEQGIHGHIASYVCLRSNI